MCTYKGANYSEGAIVRFDDGNLYQCFQGGWRLWSNLESQQEEFLSQIKNKKKDNYRVKT